MDLTANRRVLPCQFCYLAAADIDGFQFRVGNISLIFEFPQVVAPARGQIVDIDIAALVARVLPNGTVATVVEQERDTRDTLACGAVDFMNEDTGQCLVFTVTVVVLPSLTSK